MIRILISILVTLNFPAYIQAQEKVLLEKPTVDKRVELLIELTNILKNIKIIN